MSNGAIAYHTKLEIADIYEMKSDYYLAPDDEKNRPFNAGKHCSCLTWIIKWIWSGNTTITQRRPSHGTMRKSHRTFTVTRHPKDNKSKASNSLFLVKMITKLERTYSNAYQNKDQHRTPSNNGGTKTIDEKTIEQPPLEPNSLAACISWCKTLTNEMVFITVEREIAVFQPSKLYTIISISAWLL